VTTALRIRVMTALVLAAGMLAIVLWLPPVATVIVLTAGVLAGAWEWSAFLRALGKLVRVAYVAGLRRCWRSRGAARQSRPAGIVLSSRSPGGSLRSAGSSSRPRRVAPWSAALAGVFALVPAWLALMRLRLDLPNGAQWLLFVLILVWVADMGAFFFGGRYGRLRLAPAVSPGKTWEGVLGGVLFGDGGRGVWQRLVSNPARVFSAAVSRRRCVLDRR
jgi:phosphatidate cytidylyltransferase